MQWQWQFTATNPLAYGVCMHADIMHANLENILHQMDTDTDEDFHHSLALC